MHEASWLAWDAGRVVAAVRTDCCHAGMTAAIDGLRKGMLHASLRDAVRVPGEPTADHRTLRCVYVHGKLRLHTADNPCEHVVLLFLLSVAHTATSVPGGYCLSHTLQSAAAVES
jgi:hypothetical protein